MKPHTASFLLALVLLAAACGLAYCEVKNIPLLVATEPHVDVSPAQFIAGPPSKATSVLPKSYTETLVMSTGARMEGMDSAITISAIIVQDAAAFEILRIHALPQEKPDPKQLNSRYLYNGYTYIRPTKPEEIVIDIWTQDGRKWTATWVEAKGESSHE